MSDRRLTTIEKRRIATWTGFGGASGFVLATMFVGTGPVGLVILTGVWGAFGAVCAATANLLERDASSIGPYIPCGIVDCNGIARREIEYWNGDVRIYCLACGEETAAIRSDEIVDVRSYRPNIIG